MSQTLHLITKTILLMLFREIVAVYSHKSLIHSVGEMLVSLMFMEAVHTSTPVSLRNK
jgi:hypothetical protein